MKENLTLVGGSPLSSVLAPLLAWYRENARPLPWRESPDAYRVWLSEVMLQQTRIEAVRPYYARFLAEAPDIPALAALPDDRLMKLWEGLGYYSRARNLKKAACTLMEKHGGRMPARYEDIRALSGIGDYTAGAIASIVYGLPYPAVDGNVLRVITRLTADRADVLHPETKRRITAALGEVYRLAAQNDSSPSARQKDRQTDVACLTQGLMELGESVCLPGRAPACEQCPLAALCRARAQGLTDVLPVRIPKKDKRVEERLVLVLRDREGRFALRRRAPSGLLGGLWELPNIMLGTDADADRVALAFCAENRLTPGEMAVTEPAVHIFTHIRWQMQGRYLNVEVGEGCPLTFATPAEIENAYALPSAFRAFVRYIKNTP